MKEPRTELTPKQKAAAVLIGHGSRYDEVAKELEINRNSIYLWLKKPEFTALVNKTCNEYMASLKHRATRKLDEQLEAGGWLTADAIKTAYQRSDKLEGLTDSKVTIVFGEVVDTPGTPDTAYEDDVSEGQTDE